MFSTDRPDPPSTDPQAADAPPCAARPACPACGGALVELRHKLVCSVCHTICETCCEGGRG